MKKLILLFITIQLLLSQKEANIWYFGRNCGVDFSSGKPIAINNGKINTEEGSTSVCDANGKLLFYSDGSNVYNKNHVVMPNGSKLYGDESSTTSIIAVPQPETPSMYYLFTVDAAAGSMGFCYSKLNMKLQGGLGDVVANEKNVKIASTVCEKLISIKHKNGKDYWIIVHRWESNEFLAYLLTKDGLTKSPVITRIGMVHTGDNLETQGYMKSNFNGSKIALALESSGNVEVFNFDNSTGILSNAIRINTGESSYPYGVEFSPNGNLLYVSITGKYEIAQYNLKAGTSGDIVRSKVKIGGIEGTWIGALQIANDGKIYFPVYSKPYLGVISFPDEVGAKCKFNPYYVGLNGFNASLGLPSFAECIVKVEQEEKKDTIVEIKKPTNASVDENNIPISVLDRKVEKQTSLKVNSDELEIYIRDKGAVDGDIISLYLNGEWVLKEYTVKSTPLKLKIKLNINYKNNYLVLYAHNLGKISPNTAQVSLYIDGKKINLSLTSDMEKSGAINFEYSK